MNEFPPRVRILRGAPAGVKLLVLGTGALSGLASVALVAWVSPRFAAALSSNWNLIVNSFAGGKNEYPLVIGAICLLLVLGRRRWILATLVAVFALAWFTFQAPIANFVKALGVDSFVEAKDFDVKEAGFWIATMLETIGPNFRIRIWVAYMSTAIAVYLVLRFIIGRFFKHPRREKYFIAGVAVLMILFSVVSSSLEAATLFLRNSDFFLMTKRNFSNPTPKMVRTGVPVKLIVYIGESTSIMNMSVYGYPRDTTPRFSKLANGDPNAIFFDKVFSTHTHTSPSLLEALSFDVQSGQQFLPINERKRLSIVDVLKKSGLSVDLFSNQGMVGTWNQASAIIFNAANRTFSADTRRSGNQDTKLARPFDHEFFLAQLTKPERAGGSDVTFLHSYAGHGDYWDNIPPQYRIKIDAEFDRTVPKERIASSTSFVEFVEEYDSAMRYIDEGVSSVIDLARKATEPTIVVYTSDHGDAAFEGRGHDSSRFIHEMARVPFLIYFNDAAARARPDLVAKYRGLAKQGRPATLAQLSATLLDLLGLSPDPAADDGMIVTPVVGMPIDLPPIVVRETVEGISFVNLGDVQDARSPKAGRALVDRTDRATRAFVDFRNGRLDRDAYCRKTATDFGEAQRKNIVAECRLNWLPR